ncbi:MAG: response regulator transcription factor [Actinomycetia bacterium]|nr:response regulator transcription factor [Actinomycetes bacterium]MCH9801585.1 response regulator transcription factor [Actinomycetes bacterium]
MISVVLVDDHRVVVEGLRLLLDAYSDIEVIGEASDGATGAQLATELEPDVVLMDLAMPGTDGVAGTQLVSDQSPSSAVIILTTFADREGILASLDAGAVGYLMKDIEPDTLHQAIIAAATGGSPIDPRVARTLIEARTRPAPAPTRLTDKQTEVLALVAEGLPNRTIARRLGISEKTVKTHLTQIFQTLGVADRVQAALWAQEHLPDRAP